MKWHDSLEEISSKAAGTNASQGKSIKNFFDKMEKILFLIERK